MLGCNQRIILTGVVLPIIQSNAIDPILRKRLVYNDSQSCLSSIKLCFEAGMYTIVKFLLFIVREMSDY